jgi:hypothetical protein
MTCGPDLGVRKFNESCGAELLLVGQAQIHPVENNRVLKISRICACDSPANLVRAGLWKQRTTPIRSVMKRTLLVGLLAMAGVLGRPTPASADVTFFLGFSPTPDYRMTRGSRRHQHVGRWIEYSTTRTPSGRDGWSAELRTAMMNVLGHDADQDQLYATAGGGRFS